ncbi:MULTISPECIES: carboxylesterase family protein [unclassified Sphingomonas]|uniref:carboxylesterase/lipase family protein n=1 Tax=unclassified Sphingomonas TaxID=196159 RepID=UPI002269E7F1|nr:MULTISPECIES: carboxylesterase family protein [unclassified Sphingomonas]
MIALALALLAAPVIVTEQGPVRGQAIGDGGAVFRGIRFAEPPVGALRWRPPVPRRPHAAVADATAAHAACPQPAYGDWNRAAANGGSEDCLFLDIRTPRLDPAARLPVLVWIHGGGNRGGEGGGPVESPITDSGILLVSVQYRLGALGFLSHPRLSAEQGGASGNYGLMDQQAALRWVHANIARFGGDPARVTIAGGSAGAQDVGLQLLAPGSAGLFRAAIEESGTPGFGVPPRTLAQNEHLGAMIAAKAGLPATASAAALRAAPVGAILAAQEAVDVPDLDDDSFIWLQAVVDGRFLRETPAAALAAGRINHAALLIGMNARELPLHDGLAAAPSIVRREFGTHAARALAFYGLEPGATPVHDPRLGDVTQQLADDLTFRCPTIAVSDAFARAGLPVWQYQFDHARAGADVTHGSELSYVFGTPRSDDPPVQTYWTAFVKAADPNAGGLPRWPRYAVTTRAYLSIGQDATVAKAALRQPLCGWRSVM